jgi:hypothetical protein
MDPSAVSGTVKEDIVELDSYLIGQLNVMVGSASVSRSFLGRLEVIGREGFDVTIGSKFIDVGKNVEINV